MNEQKGKFILMVYKLLEAYNPEVVEEASKELTVEIKKIDLEGFYPRSEFLAFLEKLSPDAQMVIGKKCFPTVKNTTNDLDGIETPLGLLKVMDAQYKANVRGPDVPEIKILEENDHHIKMSVKAPYPDDFNEGIIRGAFDMFKILRVHISREIETIDGDKVATFDIKWEE
ncbi:MAG: hypothetical protein GF383_09390 [Candidatus Lokiarchaeota archaeon]|nr:hypothetical protein [Candidatus Lokiarchaeota archaeon]MBD3340727.1 hypothetical protein [Candidatus Lokiarchaeota archaeon]